MVNEKLAEWVKTEKAKGHSEEKLVKLLTEKGYTNEQVQEVLGPTKGQNKKTPFSVSLILLFGFGFISLLLMSIVLPIVLFTSIGEIGGYVLIALSGLGIGYLIYHVKKKLNGTERLGAVLGVLSPAFTFYSIVISFAILQKLSEQLSNVTQHNVTQQPAIMGGMNDIASAIPFLDPLISGLLFYVLANVFIIFSIIKNKKFIELAWYLIFILFVVLWFVIEMAMSSILSIPLGF